YTMDHVDGQPGFDGLIAEQLCQPFYRRQIRHKDTLGPPGSAMVAHHACQPFPQRVSEKS
nr:hypothetical protein [Streptomyces sp. DSM 41633]